MSKWNARIELSSYEPYARAVCSRRSLRTWMTLWLMACGLWMCPAANLFASDQPPIDTVPAQPSDPPQATESAPPGGLDSANAIPRSPVDPAASTSTSQSGQAASQPGGDSSQLGQGTLTEQDPSETSDATQTNSTSTSVSQYPYQNNSSYTTQAATPGPSARPAGLDIGLIMTDPNVDDPLRIDYERMMFSTQVTGELLVHVSTTGVPSRRDRRLQITLYQATWGRGTNETWSFSKEIVLPEGVVSVDDRIPFVITQGNEYVSPWDVSVYESGRDIEAAQHGPGAWGGPNGPKYHDGRITKYQSLLLLTSGIAANDLLLRDASTGWSRIEGFREQFDSTSVAARVFSTKSSDNRVYTEVLADHAPESWLFYAGASAIGIDADQLTKLATNRPAASLALQEYVMSGGELIVTGTDLESVQAQVETWLKLISGETSGASGGSPSPDRAKWNAGPSGNGRSRHADYFLGHVTLAKAGNRSNSQLPASLPANVNSVISSRMAAALPTRVGSASDGNWHWRNLISSVGKPPLEIFSAMVLLFGCLIGPGLLIFTGYAKRRSLLIFLVPAVSLVATIIIVAFSILHEGFGTSIRINSLVIYDDRLNEGMVWSRQTYFSGLPPQSGLKFENGTFVRQVLFESQRYFRADAPRELSPLKTEISDEGMVLRNWLHAREQQQLLIGHRAKAPIPIDVKSGATGGVTVTNKSKNRLQCILIRTGEETFLIGRVIAAGETAELSPLPLSLVSSEAVTIRRDLRPEMPAEIRSTQTNFYRWQNILTTHDNHEMLETVWDRFFGDGRDFPIGYYAAIMDGHEGVHVPLSGQISESSQMVIGRVQ